MLKIGFLGCTWPKLDFMFALQTREKEVREFSVWGTNLLRLCSHTPDGVCQIIEDKRVKSKELHANPNST